MKQPRKALRADQDFELMKDPRLWPGAQVNQYLCLKRWLPYNRQMQFATLYYDESKNPGSPFRVKFEGIEDSSPDQGGTVGGQELLKTLIYQGWTVD
jgi:hypothetical protein